jgi:hypothetical protein
MNKKLPILLMVFNRPNLTKKVFAKIKKYKPEKLYIACDGPRKENVTDLVLNQEVKDIFKNINWKCKVYKSYSKNNLGIKKRTVKSYRWFFSKEEKGIIFEDDCLAHPDFFKYCEILLEKYKNEKKILMINGNNFQDGKRRGKYSYYFSEYYSTYGWAGWKRTLKNYDENMSSWPQWKKSNDWKKFQKKFYNKEATYWNEIFDKTYKGIIKTWDYQLMLSLWQNKQVVITPNKNLTSHIGLGVNATNSNSKKKGIPLSPIGFPLKHPLKIKANEKADRYSFMFMPYQGIFLYFPFNLLSFFYKKFKKITGTY